MLCDECKHAIQRKGDAEIYMDGEKVGELDGVTVTQCDLFEIISTIDGKYTVKCEGHEWRE